MTTTGRTMKCMRHLLWTLLLCPLLAAARDNRENDHAQWNRDIAAFQATDRAQPPATGAVLFIGSSSIRMWRSLATDFPQVRTLNRGFGGSEIDDATFFADRIVAPYHPRAIVMYAGDNDLADGDSPARVRDDFAAFVRKARALDPDVPIAFIAIKPSVARQALLPQVRDANALIRRYAASQHGVTYLDVFTPMLGPDGQPQAKWFIGDGLHMNRVGYTLWISSVRPWLDRVAMRPASVSGIRAGRPAHAIATGKDAVVVQHITRSMRRQLMQLRVDRGEVRQRGLEQLLEAVDHEVGLLVGVDAIARAHHALDVEADAVRRG